MIKLVRPDKPVELTNEVVKSLTEEYKLTKHAVWRKDYITSNLLDMSHGKCCYCELILNVQSREMHVEHFHYKDKYDEEVVSWDNLLPACRQCNSNKGTLDTITNPIINPTLQNPREYFCIKFYMIKSKDNNRDSIGYRTIERLDLNNRKRLVNPRIELVDAMVDKLANTYDNMQTYLVNPDTRLCNRIINTIKSILLFAQPESEFSAFMSTVLLETDDYKAIKEELCNLYLWNDELESLHNKASEIALDIY